MQERFAQCYESARANLKVAAERQRKSQDKMMKGDPVLKKATFKKKLSDPWTRPYLVVRPLSDALYVLTDKNTLVAHAC